MKKLLFSLTLLLATFYAQGQAPANDDCATPAPLAVNTTTQTTVAVVDLSLATEDDSAFVTNCETNAALDYNDVWYEFTMPVDGNISITGSGSTESFTLYDMCGGVELTCRFGNGIFYNLEETVTYTLRYSERDIFAGDSSFSVIAYTTLGNDACDDRETIVLPETTEVFIATDLRAASPSTVIDNPCGENTSYVFPDLWYEFEMPVTGNVLIRNANSGTETLSLYNSCGETVPIVCEYGYGFFYDLIEGQTYVLRYAERNIHINNTSDFSLEAYETIANDTCDDRETIVLPEATEVFVTSDLRAATVSTTLDNPCGEGASRVFPDVWYEFEMPVTGNLLIRNLNSGTETLSIYNSCGDTVPLYCEYGYGYFYDLIEGQTYVLRYAERDIHINNTSDFSLEAYETIANDACDDRETIVLPEATEVFVTSDLRAATPSAALDNPCGEGATRVFPDVWYEFEMPVTGNLLIRNLNSGTETLSIYNSCGDTVPLYCEYGYGYFYDLIEGQTYVLRYAERDIHINNTSDFSLEAYETVVNDACENRETIVLPEATEVFVTSDLRAATVSTTLDNPCGEGATRVFPDVWYEFEMPVTGNLYIRNANSNTETISIYDSCASTEALGCNYGTGLLYSLIEGNTYVLRYAERDIHINTTSDFSIEVFEEEQNNECGNASALNLSAQNPVFVSTELRGATNDTEIGCEINTTRVYLDTWYDMTMPVDGEIQVNNVSNSMYIAFFDACNGTELTCFFNDGSLFNVEAGTNLKMRASVRDISANVYTFDVIAIPAPLPACVGTTEFIGGTWNNGIPDNTMNAIIRSNYNTATTIDPITMMPYGNLEACSVSIDTGRTLTIAAEDYLEVTGNILVNGTLNVAHQGNIIQRDATSVTTNNGTINVNVTTPNLLARSFMILGSPMTAETRTDVFENAFKVRNHIASNFVPDPTVAAAFPLAENFADDNGDNWINYTGVINPGEGYLVFPQPNISTSGVFDLTYSEGTLNNGDISFPVVFNTDKNSSPNILANPYPSAILANDFINANAMVDEVYFWEHLTPPSASLPGYNNANFSMEDISMYNLTGGIKAASDPSVDDTKPNGYIATAQGFGIKATAGGTAMFSNEMRRLSGNNTLRAPQSSIEKIWLEVRNSNHNLQSSTLIGFSDAATARIDAGYDSRRLASFVSLYSHVDNEYAELGIQSREQFSEDIKIHLGFSTQLEVPDARYVISLSDFEGHLMSQTTVYLLDEKTNVITNISKENYTFISGPGNFDNRFVVFFTEESTREQSSEIANSFLVYPNPTTKNITFATTHINTAINTIHIIDIVGRVVYSNRLVNANSIQVDATSLSSGTYIVKLGVAGEIITKRFVKK